MSNVVLIWLLLENHLNELDEFSTLLTIKKIRAKIVSEKQNKELI